MAELPSLDALLAADEFVKPGVITLPQWETLERLLDVVFPADYRDLALRYDLATVEVGFTRFIPPGALSGGEGLLEALRASYNPEYSPFATIFRERRVLPVGVDYAERYLMLALTQGATHYLPGTLWVFDPIDPTAPNPENPSFQPVSSSFSQAVHMAYLANGLYRGLGVAKQDGDPATPEWQASVFEQVLALDPALRDQPYWREWIAALVS